MVTEIPEYIRQINSFGSLPEIQPSTGAARVAREASDAFGNMALDMKRKAEEVDRLQSDVAIREGLSAIGRDHKGNPEAMRKAIDSFKSGFLSEAVDPGKAQILSAKIDAEGLPYIDRAYNDMNAQLDDQREVLLRRSYNGLLSSASVSSQGLRSGVPEQREASLKAVASIFNDAARLATSRKRDGSMMFSPQEQIQLAGLMQQEVLRDLPIEEQLNALYPPSGFEQSMDIVFKHEGGMGTEADGTPVAFGINKRWHEEAYESIAALASTDEAAARQAAANYYKEKFWDKHRIGELGEAQQAIVMDGAINHHPGFAKELVSAARDGASPGELIAMRNNEYERLRKTGRYTPSEVESWKNRMRTFDSLALSEFLQETPPAIRSSIEREAMKQIEKEYEKRKTDVAGWGESKGFSVEQIVAMQPDPTNARVIGNDNAKLMVEQASQMQTVDDVLQFGAMLQQNYKEFTPNAIRDLRSAKLSPLHDAAIEMATMHDGSALAYNEQIKVAVEAQNLGSQGISELYRNAGLDNELMRSELLNKFGDVRQMLVEEGYSPSQIAEIEGVTLDIARTRAAKTLSNSYGEHIEFALAPILGENNVVVVGGKSVRVPVTGADGTSYNKDSLEERLDLAYDLMLADMRKQLDKDGLTFDEDMITLSLNAERTGLIVKGLVGEPLLNKKTGEPFALFFDRVIDEESSKEKLDRIRKELMGLPYNEREVYRRKIFGLKDVRKKK